jgi:hypothetical protein
MPDIGGIEICDIGLKPTPVLAAEAVNKFV